MLAHPNFGSVVVGTGILTFLFSCQILAGANVNDLTLQKQTALHLAAAKDQSTICSILLENNIDFDLTDSNINNGMRRYVLSFLPYLPKYKTALFSTWEL